MILQSSSTGTTAAPAPAPRPRRAVLMDVLGLLLWAGLVGWVLLTARAANAVAPMRDLLLLSAASYVLSRLVSRLHRWAVPTAIAIVAFLCAVWQIGGLFSFAHRDPLGYANASAALYVVGCAAALVVAARAPRSDVRNAAYCAAGVCAVTPWMDTAFAAGLLMLPLPVALLSRPIGVRVRGVITASAVAAVAAVAISAGIAAAWGTGGPVDLLVAQTLSSNRAHLWSDALDAMSASPLYGVGANRFSVESPTAREDIDLRWAHNEYLQLGAETGVPGLLLGFAVLLWVFARIAVGTRDQGTAVTAAGLAAVAITASIDYVWHFPVVLVTTAALAGAAGGISRRRTVGWRDGNREARVHAAVTGDALWPQQLPHGRRHDPHVQSD